MDPGTLGVQSTIDSVMGNALIIDIVVHGIESTQPLLAFEFDLSFDSSFLSAMSVVDGGFLLAPVFEVQNVIGPSEIEFA